jgi:hypothetical protein
MSKNTNLSFLTDYITADITNGRIGINNASPTVAFDVVGVAKFSSSVGIGNPSTIEGVLTIKGTSAQPPTSGTTANSLLQLVGSLGAELNIGSNTVAGGYGSYIQASDNNLAVPYPLNLQPNGGSVGIGNSTGTVGTLNVTGRIALTTGLFFSSNLTSEDRWEINGGSSTDLTFVRSSVGERMRITSGGNVLIGGTSTLGASGTNLEISGGRAQLVVNSTTATASWFSVYPAGDGNTYILRNTGYSFLFGTATSQATTGFSQQMSISSNGSIGAPSGTNIYNASDARLKKNISTTTYGLNTISALNPVKFNWVDGFEPTEDGKDMLGFVAQEVQAVLPEAIESFGGNSITIGDTIIDNPLRVNEKFIIPVLVKAIQELSIEINLLKQK